MKTYFTTNRFQVALLMSFVILVSCLINQVGAVRAMVLESAQIQASEGYIMEVNGNWYAVEQTAARANRFSESVNEIVETFSDVLEAVRDLLYAAKNSNNEVPMERYFICMVDEKNVKLNKNCQMRRHVQVSKRFGDPLPRSFLFVSHPSHKTSGISFSLYSILFVSKIGG